MLYDKLVNKNLNPKVLISKVNNINPRKVGKEVTFSSTFFRVFTLYLTMFLPIVMQYIFLFTDSVSIDEQEQTRTYSLQAISYLQTLLFVILNFCIIFIVQIISRLKYYLNLNKRKEQPKKIIDTGFIVLLGVILFVTLIFIITAVSFSETRARNAAPEIAKYLYQYTYMVIPYLILSILSNYFIYLALTTGLHSIKIHIFNYLSMFLEIILTYVFLMTLKNVDPIISICIPSLIISFLKATIMGFIYFKKIGYSKKGKIMFDINIFKMLMNSTALIAIFIFCFMIGMITQTIFLSTNSGSNDFSYLITSQHYSILLITKIAVYNIFYLLIILPRSLGRSILEKYHDVKSEFCVVISSINKYKKYNFYINLVAILLGIMILFLIPNIIEGLFSSLSWTSEVVQTKSWGKQSYLQIITRFSHDAFFYGIISFFLVELSINYRIIFYKFIKRDYLSFVLIIIGYLFSITLLNYIFVIVLNNYFTGLNGYMVSQMIYGFYSCLVIEISSIIKERVKIKKDYDGFLKNKSLFKYLFNRGAIEKELIYWCKDTTNH